MRYAIISDVHANEAALRAVLTDSVDARADKIICLGDVLGYGPDPVVALELVYRNAHVCLAGNHDDAVSRRFPTEDFTDFAVAAVDRHRAALSQEAIDWLRCLPYICEFGDFACTHGDFSDPKHFNYILEPQDAMPSWNERSEQLLFVGHTHQPGIFVIGASGTPHRLGAADFTLEKGKRYIVNPGSVGYPRSGACRSCYCIYDDQSRTVFFRSLPFDLDSYAAKMHGQGLNEAPWMLVRAAERRRPAVRADAKFGAERRAMAIAPSPPLKKLKNPARIESFVPPPQRFPRGAVIAASLVIAAAVTACTVLLIRALPESGVDAPALGGEVREVPADPASAPPAEASAPVRFGSEKNIADGWTYAVENPEAQHISLEFSDAKGVGVFRIVHDGMYTVRFTKRLELRPLNDRVFWDVELASGRRGVKSNFQFTWHLVFSDENGARVGEDSDSGKLSAKNKWSRVPPDAAHAVLSIDCLCKGTHELRVPHFDVFSKNR